MRERLNVSTTTTARHTVNYDLPQWNGEDVTSWMTNLNDAFNKIDSAVWRNHTAMAGYDKIASDLQKLADDLRVDNRVIRETLGIIQRDMGEQLAQLNQAKQAIANANIAITQLQHEDNVLSATVEDLQNDIGMMMNWRKWHENILSPRVGGTITDGAGNTRNWRLYSVCVCNGMIEFILILEEEFVLTNGEVYRFDLTKADTDRINSWIASVYPPMNEPFDITPLHSIQAWGAGINYFFLYEKENGERVWRMSIGAMKDFTLNRGSTITMAAIGGGLTNG